jgi:hypothetical protein
MNVNQRNLRQAHADSSPVPRDASRRTPFLSAGFVQTLTLGPAANGLPARILGAVDSDPGRDERKNFSEALSRPSAS